MTCQRQANSMPSQHSKRSWDQLQLADEHASKQARTEGAYMSYQQSLSMPEPDGAATKSATSFASTADAASAVLKVSDVITAVIRGMCCIDQVQLSSSAEHSIAWLRQQPAMLQLDMLGHMLARNGQHDHRRLWTNLR